MPGAGESLRWQDHATELSVSRLWGVDDVIRLRVSSLAVDIVPNKTIIVRPQPGLSQVTIDHFLSDQVWPRLLAHEGSFIIHAGAVRVNGGAILLMGESGRGKSTLSASFDRSGVRLLGDDAMVIEATEDGPCVRAVYPSLRLFPDSIEAVIPGEVTAGPMAHYSSKERIDVAVSPDVGPRSLPILAMFAIAEAAEDDRVTITNVSLAASCMALVTNSFALDPSDSGQARDRLRSASALAKAVPAFEIAYPREYARLPEVRQAILNQVAVLEPA